MRNFRTIALLEMIAVLVLASCGMQLYLGFFVHRQFSEIVGGLGFITVIVFVLVGAASLVLWLILRPLARVIEALDSGASPSEAEREAARSATTRVPAFVAAVVVLGFFIGPTVSMAVNTATGKASYGLLKAFLLVALNLATGALAALETVVLIESSLEAPIARLGIHALPAGAKRQSIARRIVLAGVSTTALAALSFALAGYGALTVGIDGAPTEGDISRFVLKGLILMAVIVLWSAQVLISLSRSLARRVEFLDASVSRLARGASDADTAGGSESGKRIPVLANDEVGRLAVSLNGFFAQLGSVLARVGELSAKVLEGADSLTETANHANGAVEGLDSSLALVGEAVRRQTEAVEGSESEIGRMLESIDTVAERVADQASFVEQSSAAVSEMAANINSVSRMAERAAELSRKLAEASAEGGEALKDSLASISEIEAAMKAVRDIIGVISKIAAQTNLLAMNAAIEAAHAGEAGAGFAVVADEVRSLAESAAKSSKEIVALIKGMGQKIERGAALSDRAGEAFGRISEGVAETGELVQTIAASMGEQSAGAEEILSSVSHLTDATQTIKSLTAEQKTESRAMSESMERIVSASGEIVEALQEETGSIQSLGRVVALVSEEAAKNREHVEGLEEAVAAFNR